MTKSFLQSLKVPSVTIGPGGVVVGVEKPAEGDKSRPTPPKLPPKPTPPPAAEEKPRKKQKQKARGKKQEKAKCKRYSVSVQAQGTDIGGTTGSTISRTISSTEPITVKEGIALASQVMGLLKTEKQRKNRELLYPLAIAWMTLGIAIGGHGPQEKTFLNRKKPGGIRLDVAIHGDGKSFVTYE